jgi:hypothetical protein
LKKQVNKFRRFFMRVYRLVHHDHIWSNWIVGNYDTRYRFCYKCDKVESQDR